MKTIKQLREEFEKKVQSDFWGLCCSVCGGGGGNGVLGDGFKKCVECGGSGITDWKIDPLWDWVEQAIKEARDDVFEEVENCVILADKEGKGYTQWSDFLTLFNKLKSLSVNTKK